MGEDGEKSEFFTIFLSGFLNRNLNEMKVERRVFDQELN